MYYEYEDMTDKQKEEWDKGLDEELERLRIKRNKRLRR